MTVRSKNRVMSLVVAFCFAVTPLLQTANLSAQAKPATTQAAPAAKTAPATTAPVDQGWPRLYTTPSKGHVMVYEPQISSWANQKQHGGLRRGVVSAARRIGDVEAVARHVADRGRHARVARRAARELRQHAHHAGEFPEPAEGEPEGNRRRDHQGDSRKRSHHRARSRHRVRRQEHDQAERGSRPQVGTAEDLFQPDTGACSSTSTASRSGARSKRTI